jgi:hypothetical protein
LFFWHMNGEQLPRNRETHSRYCHFRAQACDMNYFSSSSEFYGQIAAQQTSSKFLKF